MKELLTTPAGVLALWLIVINLATFAVYGIDKSRAKRGVWRVPEKTLFLLPLLGGSIGALLGMRTFRHKTKHWYFVWGIPAILLAQIALAAAFLLFLPFLIWDRGYFIFYGDFNVQQISFYRMAHDAIRSGNTAWSWTTDLGANFVGSYSFYLLGATWC